MATPDLLASKLMADQFWSENADQWVALLEAKGIASRAVTNPALLKVVLDLKPRSVLDIGCGEGWLSEALAPSKINYQAIDGSEPLIKLAKNRHGHLFDHVTYDRFEARLWRAASPVDVTVFNFSILAKDTVPLLSAASETLRPGAHIIIQTLHPCFTLEDYREGERTEDFKAAPVHFKGVMPWYGRTLESWSRDFSNANLFIDEIFEPRIDKFPFSIIFKLKNR